MASATQKQAGFRVLCPHCGDSEGLRINVIDLSVECVECSEDVSREELQAIIDDARRLLAWLDKASEV